ncbi:MAG: hypothetical protein P8Y70_00275 [Candidatus Lokiarchaeota archaeon]
MKTQFNLKNPINGDETVMCFEKEFNLSKKDYIYLKEDYWYVINITHDLDNSLIKIDCVHTSYGTTFLI